MFQTMSESHIKDCPECDGTVRRLVGGGSGLIFKGSGFYLTDYGKGKDQKKKTDGQNGKEKKSTKTDKSKEKKTVNKKSE
jgi:predicted nucleic acid-binding Zn ribbon protein